jgi:hypothetical protein
VERAAEAVWDAEEGCAITPDDRHVEAIVDNDAEYDLSGGDTEKATNGNTGMTDQAPPEPSDPSTLNKTLYGDDLDSVTTMGTNGNQTERGKKSFKTQETRSGASPSTGNQHGTERQVTDSIQFISLWPHGCSFGNTKHAFGNDLPDQWNRKISQQAGRVGEGNRRPIRAWHPATTSTRGIKQGRRTSRTSLRFRWQ